jgi:hypothetical protein
MSLRLGGLVVGVLLGVLTVPSLAQQQKLGQPGSIGKMDVNEVGKLQKLAPAAGRAKRTGPVQIPDPQAKANTYLVLLINSTDFHVRKARVNGGAWFPTQDIGRTCNSNDYNTCFDRQAWQPLMTVGCGESIQVTVAWPNSSGGYDGATWDPFTADCSQYSGGVLQLTP